MIRGPNQHGCMLNLPTLAWWSRCMYDWSFHWSLYVNSPPTVFIHGSKWATVCISDCKLVGLYPSWRLCRSQTFPNLPPHLDIHLGHTPHVPLRNQEAATPSSSDLHLPLLWQVAASLLHHTHIYEYSPISAWLATIPVISIWSSMAVAKPGGLPTHNLWREKMGIWLKWFLRNGTYHGFKPPRNYIAAVIVIT
jgi:hypothetical protein